MTTKEIYDLIAKRFAAESVVFKEGRVDSWIEIDPQKIREFCLFLRDDEDMLFDILFSISGVDYPKENKIAVVYHLFSFKHLHSLTVKAFVDRNNSHMETVESVWKGANWLEREMYDIFGVVYDGHSDLRRILLPEDWEGYPLRKDYVTQPLYHGIEVGVARPLAPTTIKTK